LWGTDLARLARDARINSARALERGIKCQDLGMKKKKLLFTAIPAKSGSPSSLKLRLKSAPFELIRRDNILDQIEVIE
jgi:hypothetical protein